MDIEKIPVQAWTDVITGKVKHEFEFLALKILLARLSINIQYDSSPQALQRYTDDLKNLFYKSTRIPSAQKDLQKINGHGGLQ